MSKQFKISTVQFGTTTSKSIAKAAKAAHLSVSRYLERAHRFYQRAQAKKTKVTTGKWASTKSTQVQA